MAAEIIRCNGVGFRTVLQTTVKARIIAMAAKPYARAESSDRTMAGLIPMRRSETRGPLLPNVRALNQRAAITEMPIMKPRVRKDESPEPKRPAQNFTIRICKTGCESTFRADHVSTMLGFRARAILFASSRQNPPALTRKTA